MTCGIYKITNLINGKIYIGQSVNIERRWGKHKRSTHNNHLESAFKKHGIDNFTFSIICECPKSALDEYEILYIKYYETTNPSKGYNKTFGGSGGKKSNEAKMKMSEAAKKKPAITDITRTNMSNASKGRFQTVETRMKHSIPVMINGVEYYSRQEASRRLGISMGTLYYRLSKNKYV